MSAPLAAPAMTVRVRMPIGTALAAPPIRVRVAGAVPTVRVSLALPPIRLALTAETPRTPPMPARLAFALAAAGIGADAPAPSAVTGTIALVAPISVSSGGSRPAFTVAVDTDTAGQWAEIQYDTDPGFGQAVSVLVAAPAGLPGALVTTTPAGNIADGVWWWRARLAGGYGAGEWTAAATFAVNSLEGQAVAVGGFTIDAAAQPATHLWYIDHAESGDDAGAAAVVIGTGFGTAPRVEFGDTDCAIVETITVPAYPDPDPGIEPGVRCDPWHQQTTFTIPAVDPDHNGDAITVIGGDA